MTRQRALLLSKTPLIFTQPAKQNVFVWYTRCIILFLFLLNSVRSNHSSSWLLFPKLSYASTRYMGFKAINKEFIHYFSLAGECFVILIIPASSSSPSALSSQVQGKKGGGQSLTLIYFSFLSCLCFSLQCCFHFSPGAAKQAPSPSHLPHSLPFYNPFSPVLERWPQSTFRPQKVAVSILGLHQGFPQVILFQTLCADKAVEVLWISFSWTPPPLGKCLGNGF